MRLRKLVVHGFKSFADRTEFDFDQGVTCIVGPNGCGKSNVVDSIKWALGEQSAKNLRGKGMLDVIFNGTAARKPLGMAEVLLTFDNADRVLPVNSDEVQIGRRLFRTGESDYLINGTAARLKDIRDLFFDTGVGRTGYSIIEQGRVSQFVDSTPKDRRLMFEEAAGISRFKVRIAEASRKLEQVTSNLQRVGDVVEELERRLRSVKVQAGRARTYQELSGRLRELRRMHARAEHRRLAKLAGERSAAWERAKAELATSRTRADELASRVDRATASVQEFTERHRVAESHRAGTQSAADQAYSQIVSNLQRMDDLARSAKAAQERAKGERSRRSRLLADAAGHERHAAELEQQISGLHEQITAAQSAVHDAARAQQEIQGQLDDENSGVMDLMRRTTRLHSEIEGLTRQADALVGQRDRLETRRSQITGQLEQEMALQQELARERTKIDALLAEQNKALDAKREEAKQLGTERSTLLEQIGTAKQQRSALESRQKVLADLERRREGLGAGVRTVLDQAGSGPFAGVVSIVADLFDADAQHARCIEAALGPWAQAIVCRNADSITQAAEAIRRLPSRVTFVPLEGTAERGVESGDQRAGGVCEGLPLPSASHPAPPGCAAVPSPTVAAHAGTLETIYQSVIEVVLSASCTFPLAAPALPAAASFVRCADEYAPLRDALLGTTLVCESLDVVRDHAGKYPPGTRFVTLSGDLVDCAFGVSAWTLTGKNAAGDAAAGLISRRAELAELATQLAEVDSQLAELSTQAAGLGEAITHAEQVQKQLRQAIYATSTELTDVGRQIARVDEAVRRLTQEEPVLSSEMAEITKRLDQARAQREQNSGELAELAERKKAREESVVRLQQALREAQAKRVELAQAESQFRQQVAGLAAKRGAALTQLASARRAADDAERAVRDADAESSEAADRIRRAEMAVLAAEGRQAMALYELDSAVRVVRELTVQRDAARAELASVSAEYKQAQSTFSVAQETAHAAEIASHDAAMRVNNLLSRVKDELDVDLLGIEEQQIARSFLLAMYDAALRVAAADVKLAEPLPPDWRSDDVDWSEVEVTIAELRKKIERLGNVNVDAISELADLERRHEFLIAQRHDLEQAAGQLQELIDRLNTESRQRFMEAFTQIRENFSAMFRKLFAGGKADIVLEKNPDGTDADVLEAGIEIFARPPGMEPKTLTLLSGGQKAMIAVAILMSIFQARPSPFCILDEVDAPLDEANNLRFNGIVREFLSFTQFIVITHSKPTMNMADRMYGVTMQEPGVSQRVGVRFDQAGRPALIGGGVVAGSAA